MNGTALMRRFNVWGYGLTLVDPKGFVRGVNLRYTEVARLLSKR